MEFLFCEMNMDTWEDQSSFPEFCFVCLFVLGRDSGEADRY